MPNIFETADVLTFEAQGLTSTQGGGIGIAKLATLIRTTHPKTFRTQIDLNDHNLIQGKEIADAISRILPAPVVSVVVARLMETMFRNEPLIIPDNEQPKGGGTDAE